MLRFRNRNFGTDRKNSNKIDEEISKYLHISFSIEFARIFPIGTRAYLISRFSEKFGYDRSKFRLLSYYFGSIRSESRFSRIEIYADCAEIFPCRARNFKTSHISKIFTYEQRILNLSFC